MVSPESTHDVQGIVRQRYKAILGPFTSTDMNAVIVSVNVLDLQVKRFRQTKSERVSDDNENTVS